jgi:hypothetical protein
VIDIIERHIGYAGAMLSGTKQKPAGLEDHEIFWNACLFVKHGRGDKSVVQEWWGDLDVTAQEANLQALANELGHTVYVTREHPWRWKGFAAAKKDAEIYNDRSIFTFKPNKKG